MCVRLWMQACIHVNNCMCEHVCVLMCSCVCVCVCVYVCTCSTLMASVCIAHPSFSDGMSRSGVFITCMTEIERVKVEGGVDIFQTVKGARAQRPHIVYTSVSNTPYCTLLVACRTLTDTLLPLFSNDLRYNYKILLCMYTHTELDIAIRLIATLL